MTGDEIVMELDLDPAWGVERRGYGNDYYFDRVEGVFHYYVSYGTTEITLDFVKMPMLDFGEKHVDLMKSFGQESQIYDGHWLKIDLINALAAGNLYFEVLDVLIRDYGTMVDGKARLIDNNEHILFLSRNSADAGIDDLAKELWGCNDDVNNDYNKIQEGELFYLVWYGYDLTAGEGQSCDRNSSKSLSFTFKRSLEDGGFEYKTLGQAFYTGAVQSFVEKLEEPGSTFECFDHAEIDGVSVEVGKEEGSLVLSLSPELLNTLSAGEHELKVCFKDGLYAQAAFTINESTEPDPTPTPDPTPAPVKPEYVIPVTGVE